jgi:hypothetical protein
LNPNDAVLKDALVLLRREDYARDMVQRESTNDAALKDAQNKLGKEECA